MVVRGAELLAEGAVAAAGLEASGFRGGSGGEGVFDETLCQRATCQSKCSLFWDLRSCSLVLPAVAATFDSLLLGSRHISNAAIADSTSLSKRDDF